MILSEQEYKARQLSEPAIFERPGQADRTKPFHAYPVFTLSKTPVKKTTSWKAVSGADKVEVIEGSISFGASSLEEKTLTSLSLSKRGKHHIINFGQSVRLSSLTLDGFTFRPSGTTQDIPFSSSSDARLVIAIPNDQTEWLPLYGIPHLSKKSTPKQFAGASLNGDTVRFPQDIQPVNKIRLSVIRNFTTDDEEILSSTIGSSTARIKNLPEDLTLRNETDKSLLFENKGVFLNNTPELSIDLVHPAQSAFDRQLAEQKPFSFDYTLQAKSGTAFHYSSTNLKGAILRTFEGVSTTKLDGEEQPLKLDLSSGALDAEKPASAAGDLIVSYEKLRLLDRLNDDLPAASGNVSGRIVRDKSVSRVLLDAEITTYPIDRIGVIGRAPEACELSLWLTPQAGGTTGEALTAPGVVQLEASTGIQVIWIALPHAVTHEGALVLQLRANSGRFFWVTNPEPAIKVVVQDPHPNGREIEINNRLLTRVDEERIHMPQAFIQPDLFTARPPLLSSSLFVTIELSDLTLRYAR